MRNPLLGPHIVQIDISEQCSQQCLVCWCNSPFLHQKRLSGKLIEKSLFCSLLSELKKAGTQVIYFSGGGEPTEHPDFLYFITRACSMNFTVILHTNLRKCSIQDILSLCSAGIHSIVVSLWAGDDKTYCSVHPGAPLGAFDTIISSLKQSKKIRQKNSTLLKIHNVIFSHNVHNIECMLETAEKIQAESVEFTLHDPMSDFPASLNINENELFAADQLLKRNTAYTGNIIPLIIEKSSFSNVFPCYAPWHFARITADGSVFPCLKAQFPLGNLNKTSFIKIWNNREYRVFRKAISGIYPFSRMLLKIGNSNNPWFGCLDGCDNRYSNQMMKNRIKSLNTPRLIILGVIEKILRSLW